MPCEPLATPSPHTPPVSLSAPRPTSYAVLSNRQQALAFNQPLNFDTSSVTQMGAMFAVRSAGPSPANRQRALPSPHTPHLFPCSHLSPPHSTPFTSTVCGVVQPAAEFRHIQSHKHDVNVCGAAPRVPYAHNIRLGPSSPNAPPISSCVPALAPSHIAPLSTRQTAFVFNQPLGFDTSSVIDMNFMFYVRSARTLPLSPIGPFSACVACAADRRQYL